MIQLNVMTLASLRMFLQELNTDEFNRYQVWLSSDEEGNQILPMLGNAEISIGVDLQKKRVILFPAHR